MGEKYVSGLALNRHTCLRLFQSPVGGTGGESFVITLFISREKWEDSFSRAECAILGKSRGVPSLEPTHEKKVAEEQQQQHHHCSSLKTRLFLSRQAVTMEIPRPSACSLRLSLSLSLSLSPSLESAVCILKFYFR